MGKSWSARIGTHLLCVCCAFGVYALYRAVNAQSDADIVESYYHYLWRSSDAVKVDAYFDFIVVGDSAGAKAVRGVVIDGASFSDLSRAARSNTLVIPNNDCDVSVHPQCMMVITFCKGSRVHGVVECRDNRFVLMGTCDKQLRYKNTDVFSRLLGRIEKWEVLHPDSVSISKE